MTVEEHIERELRKALDYQLTCPTCDCLLLYECVHEDHDGVWCTLCGYHRPQLRREDGNDGATPGRTEPPNLRGIA